MMWTQNKQGPSIFVESIHLRIMNYECDVQVAMCCSCLIGRQTCHSGSLPSYRLRYVVPNERLPEGPHVTLILNRLEGSSGPLELAVPALSLSLSLLCFLFFFYKITLRTYSYSSDYVTPDGVETICPVFLLPTHKMRRNLNCRSIVYLSL